MPDLFIDALREMPIYRQSFIQWLVAGFLIHGPILAAHYAVSVRGTWSHIDQFAPSSLI
jgi:hypothetical protein